MQILLDSGIIAVMEGRITAKNEADAALAVGDLRSRGVDGILLGCTEIPYLLPGIERDAHDLLDPLPLLAEAAVRRSMG
jgi:aspartate/glutamate racemase